MFAIPPQSAVALGSASAAATINTTGVLGQRKPAAPPPTVPSRTLYVRNLNEAINHARTFVVSCNWGEQGSHNTGLTKALEKLLASFGPVLDLKVKRNVKHRGQAFVSYASQDLADKVKKELQGFELFGKAMVCGSDLIMYLQDAYWYLCPKRTFNTLERVPLPSLKSMGS